MQAATTGLLPAYGPCVGPALTKVRAHETITFLSFQGALLEAAEMVMQVRL